HVVVTGEYCGWRIRESQQLAPRLQTRLEHEVALLHESRVVCNSVTLERESVTGKPAAAREMVGMADDESDPPVSKVYQVSGHLARGVDVVHVDARGGV